MYLYNVMLDTERKFKYYIQEATLWVTHTHNKTTGDIWGFLINTWSSQSSE